MFDLINSNQPSIIGEHSLVDLNIFDLDFQVSDHKCPATKPQAKEVCQIPDCFTYAAEHKEVIQAKRKSKAAIDNFESGPIYTVTVNTTDDNYSFSAAGGWLYTEWSEVSLFRYCYQ